MGTGFAAEMWPMPGRGDMQPHINKGGTAKDTAVFRPLRNQRTKAAFCFVTEHANDRRKKQWV